MACDETCFRFFGKEARQAAVTPRPESAAKPNDTNSTPFLQSFPDRKTLGPLPLCTTAVIYRLGNWREKSPVLRSRYTNRQQYA